MPQYWLMKSEPEEASVDDYARAPRKTIPWTGVRNYQARNFMRDQMAPGDGVLFYHSSCAEPGVVGIARITGAPEPDPTQFDPASAYHDPKSTREAGYGTIVSARSGETEDVAIVHLATGWDAGQLKVGSFARSERMAKWNEGVRLETRADPPAGFWGSAALRRGSAR